MAYQGSSLTKHSPSDGGGNSTQWIPLPPKGGGLIQVDIGSHPPIPLTQKQLFQFDSFSTIFRVLNFRGHFEALNDIFLAS